MADPIEEAAKLLGLDPADLRKVKAQKDRDEVKSIVREVLEDFFGDDDDGGDDGDDGGDDDSLRGQATRAAAGKKTRKPKPKPKDDDDDGTEPKTEPTSLAARLGLSG